MAFHIRFKTDGVQHEKFADAEETLDLLVRSLTLNGCEIEAIEPVQNAASPPGLPA